METSLPAMHSAHASIADVVAHRAYLVRFALRRLRDPMLAEDAVHDVFEAVLSGRALDRIEAMPSGLRDAMRLRVIDERSTESVCRELGISEENLFVRVHRARKQLLS